MEQDDTQQPQATRPPHRIRAGMVLAALAAVAAVTLAAGLALARTGSRIGTGVVVIDTNLAYQGEKAAGTGMVLTSSGLVLTNNHVIRDATAIRVVVPGTGRSYAAGVVGYDVPDDVAVLQVRGGSDLKTMPLGSSASLTAGQSVKAVGNAGGTGSLTSATGAVTGTGRAITVSDDQGGSESLSGMIETNADLQPGDSGGPLLNTSGQVVGMDTAASAGNGQAQAATGDGYAIPIDRAEAIASQIVSGDASSSVHVGGTAFVGVEVASDSADGSGAVVTSVVPGSPAASAGLVPGDLITSLGGRAISSPTGLTSIVMSQKPGVPVSATYIDQTGATQTASLTLASGPPH